MPAMAGIRILFIMTDSLSATSNRSLLLVCEEQHLALTLSRLVQHVAPDIVVRTTVAIEPPVADDVILMVHGGAVDAYEIQALLRTMHPTALVLMVVPDESAGLQRAFDAGAAECMVLPLREHEVAARLQRVLSMHAVRRLGDDHMTLLRDSLQDIGDATHIGLDEMLMSLDRLAHFHDEATGEHGRRVGHYASCIAEAAGLPLAQRQVIKQMAPLHDIGKVGVSLALLNKNGKLDDDEMKTMRMHAQMGYEILANSASPLLQAAAIMAGGHHERFDGRGYPQGLSGERIPLEARIVALADAYDALLSVRPYKAAWSVERVHQFLVENRGVCFDPELVDVFLHQRNAGWSLPAD